MITLRRWVMPIILSITMLVSPAGATPDALTADFLGAAIGISSRWKVNLALTQEIIDAAIEYSDPIFPRPEHILAIMAVESGFNPSAKSHGNVGLMQLNLAANGKHTRSMSLRENVQKGSEILRECYLRTGRIRSAVLAYNAGLGNFLRGKYSSSYWAKFKKELSWITKEL